MPFSGVQKKSLAIIVIPSSLLSMIGSSSIAYRVVARQTKKSPYDRILLGLSCFDILLSLLIPFREFLVDKEISGLEWAFGNEASCRATGFLFQTTSISVILYNGGLSLYFLAVVRFSVPQEKFSKRFEPILHFFAICYPFCTAIAGLALNLFAVQDGGEGRIACWVPPEKTLASWLFGGLPLVASFMAVVFSNVVIYVFVRKTTRRTRRSSMSPDSESRRIHDVAVQALFYVGSFALSYIWPLGVILSGFHKNKGAPFPVAALSRAFFPMQGFWNGFIYARPRYRKFRSSCREASWFVAMRWSVFGDEDISEEIKESSHPPQSCGSRECITNPEETSSRNRAEPG